MNEIDFARGCRAVRTGDLVVFSHDDEATVDPDEAAAVGFCGFGLLTPRSRCWCFEHGKNAGPAFMSTFFQDALYGTGFADPRAAFFRCGGRWPPADSNVPANVGDSPQVVRWRQRIAAAIGCSLDTGHGVVRRLRHGRALGALHRCGNRTVVSVALGRPSISPVSVGISTI